MHPLLLQITTRLLSIEIVLSVFSVVMTAYFWMVRARQERPNLKIFQLQNFRSTLRYHDKEKKTKQLALSPFELGGVLVANNSTRQTSIIRFDCFLDSDGDWVKGKWGYLDNDKPPWNIGPESTIGLSPACYFEVSEDYETPDDARFFIEFITVSGRRFSQEFSLVAPEL